LAAAGVHVVKKNEYVEALRKLRKEDPKAFKKLMQTLTEKLEAEGYEVACEILYDN